MKNKRILSIILALTMVITGVFGGSQTYAASEFTDMPNDWAKPGLEHAVEHGLLKGDKNMIRPGDSLSRAELATIAVRMLGLEKMANIEGYKDVKKGDWFYDYMAKAVEAGIIKGDSDTSLSPQRPATRDEVFSVIARIFLVETDEKDAYKKFKDAKDIPSWASEDINALVANEYIKGDNANRLNPRKPITRAEFATLTMNIVRDFVSAEGVLSDRVVDGNLVVNAKNVDLKGVTVKGDLILAEGVGASDIGLSESKVMGRILVRSGSGLKLIGTDVDNIRVTDKLDSFDIEIDKDSSVDSIKTDSKINVSGEGKVIDRIDFNLGSNGSKVETSDTKVVLNDIAYILDREGNKIDTSKTINIEEEEPEEPEEPEDPNKPIYIESIVKGPMFKSTNIDLLAAGELEKPVWVEVQDEKGKVVGTGGMTQAEPGFGLAQIKLETPGNYVIVVKDEKDGKVLGEIDLKINTVKEEIAKFKKLLDSDKASSKDIEVGLEEIEGLLASSSVEQGDRDSLGILKKELGVRLNLLAKKEFEEFKLNHSKIIVKDEIVLEDKEAIEQALKDYENLSASARKEDKEIGDKLRGKLERLAPLELAIFEENHKDILEKEEIVLEDRKALESALEDFGNLSAPAQKKGQDIKEKLDKKLGKIELDIFKKNHKTILNKVTVDSSDRKAIESALEDFGNLSASAQEEGKAIKANLDEKLAKISGDELAIFKENHKAILEKDEIVLEDREAIESALKDFEKLSASAQKDGEGIENKLYEKLGSIDYQEFKAKHKNILDLKVDAVDEKDVDSLVAALEDYESLSEEAKKLAAAEKTDLDAKVGHIVTTMRAGLEKEDIRSEGFEAKLEAAETTLRKFLDSDKLDPESLGGISNLNLGILYSYKALDRIEILDQIENLGEDEVVGYLVGARGSYKTLTEDRILLPNVEKGFKESLAKAHVDFYNQGEPISLKKGLDQRLGQESEKFASEDAAKKFISEHLLENLIHKDDDSQDSVDILKESFEIKIEKDNEGKYSYTIEFYGIEEPNLTGKVSIEPVEEGEGSETPEK